MKEYTLIAALSVVLVVLIDKFSGIYILRQKLFYLFLVVILGFKFLVNGYLTASGIVMYDRRFFLGVRALTIPLEDFLFGFSMVTLGIILWEFFKKREK